MTQEEIKAMQRRVGVEDDGIAVEVHGKTVLIDAEDMHFLTEFRWYVDTKGYVYRHDHVEGRDSPKRLHREILKAAQGVTVDHINGDRLDNRRSNLRLCTQRQNLFNSGKKKTNKSGFKGVDFRASKGKFRARIRHAGGRVFLGYFNSSEDASKAYTEAAKQLHGEFANLV